MTTAYSGPYDFQTMVIVLKIYKVKIRRMKCGKEDNTQIIIQIYRFFFFLVLRSLSYKIYVALKATVVGGGGVPVFHWYKK